MIPSVEENVVAVEIEQQSTNTYKLDLVNNRIIGMTDGLDAMKQAVFKILNTERYENLIYSWNYGVEFIDVIGKPTSYAYSEIKRFITEALMQDERVTGVDDFTFTSVKNAVSVQFKVHTTEGDIEIGKVVNI